MHWRSIRRTPTPPWTLQRRAFRRVLFFYIPSGIPIKRRWLRVGSTVISRTWRGGGLLKNTKPRPHRTPTPPNRLDGTQRTPEQCSRQAEGSLSNRVTVRMVRGFDRCSRPVRAKLRCYRRVRLPFNYISPRADPEPRWCYEIASRVGCRVSGIAPRSGRSRSHAGAAWVCTHPTLH